MIHQNLERRFIHLAVGQSAYRVALESFRVRYSLLFAALAEDLGYTPEKLAAMVGFDPVPKGGNAIMRGEAEPSDVDVLRLLEVYLSSGERVKVTT